FVSPEIEDMFYRWDKAAEERVPLGGDSLTGKVVAVTRGEKEYRNKPVPKLQVTVEAGLTRYVIETGRYTAFARSLLKGLSEFHDRLGDLTEDLVTITARSYTGENTGDTVA